MEYRKCVDCAFNVAPQAERCGDCGILHPLQPTKVTAEDYSFLIALAVIAALLIPSLYFGSQTGVGGIICCALPLGLILAALLGGVTKAISETLSMRSKRSGDRQLANRRAPYPESLCYKENTIKGRITELSERERQVNAVLERAKQNAGEKWEQVRATLEASAQTLKRQRARYNAKSVEIDMVRLQNRLAPFICYPDELSYERIDALLKILEASQNNAVALGKRLDEEREVLGRVPDIEELSQRLSDIQESMRKLRDAFVGQQAVLALKGITPLDDTLTAVSRPLAAIREADVFNIQVAITDFSTSFDELESEYIRVQSEEDVAQRIGEIINREET
jgi:hypothetical protein